MDQGTPSAAPLAPLAFAFGFLQVDPTVLVPLANIFGAHHAAQAWAFGLDHAADPEAVDAVPLGPVELPVVPAVGAQLDRPVPGHSHS